MRSPRGEHTRPSQISSQIFIVFLFNGRLSVCCFVKGIDAENVYTVLFFPNKNRSHVNLLCVFIKSFVTINFVYGIDINDSVQLDRFA